MKEDDKDKDLKELLERKFDRSTRLIESFNTQWKENTAFYLGDHWVKYDDTVKKLRKVKVDELAGESRITVNLTRKNIETLVSQILGSTPIFEAVPTTEEEKDVSAARISEKGITIFWDYFKVVKILRSARRIAEILGHSFVEVYWDWTKGQLMRGIEYTEEDTKNPVLIKGIPKTNKDGKPLFYKIDRAGQIQNKNQHIGDLGLNIRFPDTVFPNPDAWDFSYNRRCKTDARWVFLSDFLTIEEIKNHDGWELPLEEDINITEKPLMSFSQQLVYELLGTTFDSGAADEKFCQVLRYFEFPSLEYPQGRYMVILPDNEWHLLENNNELPSPYENEIGICPLVKFHSLKMEGIFCSASRINDAGQLNQEYDQMRSLGLDKVKKFQPIIFVDKASGLKIENIKTTVCGHIIEVNRGGYMNKDLGVDVFNPTPSSIGEKENTMMLKAEQEDLYNVHEPSRYPPEERTLGEVNLIQAYDINRLKATSVADAEEGYEDLARLMLLYAQQNYTEERIFRLIGEKNRLQVYRFKGSDLGYQDIRIQPASSMPISKYISQQRLLFLMGQGFFKDTGDEGKRMILKLLDMKEVTPVREDDYDELNAENENYDMLMGKEPDVMPEDNNLIHLKSVRLFLKSPEVRNLPPKERKEVVARLYRHKDKHQRQLIAKEEINTQILNQITAQQASESLPPLANTGQEQPIPSATSPPVELEK